MNTVIAWSPGMTLEEVEKQVILMAFRHFKGNKTQTALALGVAVRTLDARFEQYKEEGKKQDDDREQVEKQKHEFSLRQRGLHPDQIKAGYGSASRIHVEPAFEVTAQSRLSMSVGEKIQGVLPGTPSPGSHRNAGQVLRGENAGSAPSVRNSGKQGKIGSDGEGGTQ